MALDSGSSAPVSSPGRGTALCSSLDKILYCHSALDVKMSTSEINAGGNPAMDYHPIQREGDRNTPSRFMVQKPG